MKYYFLILSFESWISKLDLNIIWYVCLNVLSVYFYPQKLCYTLNMNYSLLGVTMLYMLTRIWMVRRMFLFYISKTIFSNNIFLSNSSFLHFALSLANCMINLYSRLYPVFLHLHIFPKRGKENSLINT